MAPKNGETSEVYDVNLNSCNFSNGERFESEIPDSSYSLSLPSEPPDLRNWFSGYVYDSPELDTRDGFSLGDSQSKGFDSEDINKVKNEDLGQFKISSFRDSSLGDGTNSINELVECQRFRDDDNLENQGSNKVNQLVESNENPSCRNACSDESLEGKLVQTHDFISLKDEELDQNGRNALPSLDAIKEEEEIHVPSKASRQHPKGDNALVSSPVIGASVKKPIGSSDGKENKLKVLASDGGFVSTRKNRTIRETNRKFPRSDRITDENLKIERMISRIDVEGVGVVRKALSERTNIQSEPIVEIAGKWKCPRRNKPDLGPPLKQLRLEQWVHRM